MKIKLNKRTLFTLIAILLCLATIGTTVGVTLAMYVTSKQTDNLAVPERFYFESDVLTENGADINVGFNSIKFELLNYVSGGYFSEKDIVYKTTIASDDEGASLGVAEHDEGTLEGGKTSSVLVTYGDLTPGATYTITAETTSPYKKTIQATFTLAKEANSVIYASEERAGGEYVILTVKTNALDALVNIYWQEGYVPDNSNKILADAQGTSLAGVKLSEYSSYELRFFKSSNVTYDPARFYVEISTFLAPDDGSVESGPVENPGGEWD